MVFRTDFTSINIALSKLSVTTLKKSELRTDLEMCLFEMLLHFDE